MHPLDVLPDPRRPDAARAIATTFPGLPIESLTRVPAGLSGAGIYRLTVAGRPYLLRLEVHADGLRDTARHHACLRIAADAGVAPPTHHLDPATGISISTFIEGPTPAELPRAPRLAAIATTLRTLHSAPAFPPLIGFFDGMVPVWDQAEAAGVLPADLLARHRERYRAVVAAYPAVDEPLVASHNDLNPSNVVYGPDGRAWFVDWELAFAADRFVDLAGATLWSCADAAEADAFLATYFGRPPTAAERARFDAMALVIRWFYGTMILGGVARERPGLRLTAAEAETPPLAELRGQMASMATFEGRVLFGCAFMNEAYRDAAAYRTPSPASFPGS